jgi:hypothetical protein
VMVPANVRMLRDWRDRAGLSVRLAGLVAGLAGGRPGRVAGREVARPSGLGREACLPRGLAGGLSGSQQSGSQVSSGSQVCGPAAGIGSLSGSSV